MRRLERSSSGGTQRSSPSHSVAALESSRRCARGELVGAPRRRAAGERDVPARRRRRRRAAPRRPRRGRRRRGSPRPARRLTPALIRRAPAGLERGPVGRVAQQRLAHALAEDAALAARGAQHVQACSLAVARAAHRAQPARRAVERRRRSPEAVSIVTPPSPGAPMLDGLERRARPRRAARARGRRARRRGARAAPAASPAARPASRRTAPPAATESCAVAHGRPLEIAAERARSAGGSNAAATRSRHGVERSQARSTTYARARQVVRRARSASRDVGLVLRVDEHDLREPAQRVDGLGVAVRRPHHRREVGDEQRVDDRVEARQVLRADVDLDPLAADGDVPGPVLGVLGADRGPGVERRAPGLDRARSRAATGGSARRARAGSRSRRGTRGRRPRRGSCTRAGTNARSSWWRSAEEVRAAPPRSRSASCRARSRRPRSQLAPAPTGAEQRVGLRRARRCRPRRSAAGSSPSARATPGGSGR